MYNEKLNALLEKLDDIQKALIDDLDAEGLEPDDIEFEKMMNERALSDKEKEDVYQFYIDRAALKTKCYFDELDDIDKAAIDDLLADNLYPGDVEFEQLLNERAVNKKNIYKYFDNKKKEFLLNYSKKEKGFIDKLIKDRININDDEFNKRIKDNNYDKDKIIRYINNINWINDKKDYIKEISNNAKKESQKVIKETKSEEEPINDEVEITDKKREIFNEIQNNIKKKDEVLYDKKDNNKVLKSNKTKLYDPYNGLDYYQRLSLYAKEKEMHPSNIDKYDDELIGIKRKEHELKKLKKKKSILVALKNSFKTNDLGDEGIKKLGFIDVFTISMVVIILCALFVAIINLFK